MTLGKMRPQNFLQKQRLSLLTFVFVFDQCLIDVLLLGVFQDVEETQVDSVRLFNDDVQQRLGSFDWTISQRLNWLQVSESQRVTLIHMHSHYMCVQFGCQVPVLWAQYLCTFNAYINTYKPAIRPAVTVILSYTISMYWKTWQLRCIATWGHQISRQSFCTVSAKFVLLMCRNCELFSIFRSNL